MIRETRIARPRRTTTQMGVLRTLSPTRFSLCASIASTVVASIRVYRVSQVFSVQQVTQTKSLTDTQSTSRKCLFLPRAKAATTHHLYSPISHIPPPPSLKPKADFQHFQAQRGAPARVNPETSRPLFADGALALFSRTVWGHEGGVGAVTHSARGQGDPMKFGGWTLWCVVQSRGGWSEGV